MFNTRHNPAKFAALTAFAFIAFWMIVAVRADAVTPLIK